MPDRFGQAGDYSQTFSYLADNYMSNLEAQADKAQARNESEQAARDTEAFARYDAGKMSGDELLAYIRRRISATAYDPKQQAEWKKALLEYTESINDSKALTAFEQSNDYNGYISYLRSKMASANPQKRAEIQGQLNQLIDQRDSQNVTRGAERIMLQINKGKASYEDLLAFYKNALGNTRKGSTINQQIRSQITNVAQQVKANNLTLRKGKLDTMLANLDITPQEYGRRLQDLARSSGLETTNPEVYNQWMTLGAQSIKTVTDFGRLAQIDGMLQRKEITPQQAMNMYYAEAERYRDISPTDYQKIRNEGWKIGNEPQPGFTPLPNPGLLGLPDGLQQPSSGGMLGGTMTAVEASKNLILKWITQLDGSEFSQVNCVYSASAMLAYAMGYRDKNGVLSGGDLRYLSGDRSIGTNLDEAQAAMEKLGISGLRNWNDKHIGFDQFKERVGNRGMPAVLMGINNNLPDSLKAFKGAARGHGIFIAAYDAKKKMFLMYDPAVSKNSHPDYNGVWVDEKVIKNFGWGPGYSDSTGSWNFNGQALFAPPGTLKGSWSADSVKRPAIKYVNVDDAPVRPETPKHYKGRTNRGPSTVEPVGNEAVDKNGRARAGKNGKAQDDLPDTVEEVQQILGENRKKLQLIGDRINQGDITDPNIMRKIDQETLDIFDQSVLYAEAAGLGSEQKAFYDDRIGFLAGVKQRNSLKADVIINTAVRDARKDFENALKDPDPQTAIKSMQVIKGRLQILNGVQQVGNLTDTQVDDLSTDPKDQGNSQSLDAIISLLDMVTTPGQGPVAERLPDILRAMDAVGATADERNDKGEIKSYGNDLGNLIIGMMEQRDGQDKIEAGTHVAVIDGQTGGTVPLPLLPKYDITTGQTTQVPDMGVDGQGHPVQGIQVPVQTATGVEMRWVAPSAMDTGMVRLQASKAINIEGLSIKAGAWLNEQQVTFLAQQGLLQQAISAGQLTEQPLYVTQVRMPDRKGRDGKIISGTTFFQDDSGAWFTGTMPVSSYGAVGGKYIGSNPDTSPQFNYLPYATAGMVPLPYQGNRDVIQKAIDSGEITVPEVGVRGLDGNLTDNIPEATPRFSSPFDPKSPRNQLGMPTTAFSSAPEPEDDRAERLRETVKDILSGVANLRGNDSGLAGTDNTFIFGPDASPSIPQGPQQGGTVPMPTGDRAYANGPQGPQGMQEFNVPSATSLGFTADLTGLAGSLGVKVGGPKGPQGPLPGPAISGPKGPQGPGYTPPAPKPVRGPGGKKETSLPKIGSAVMVGGTQINLPGPAPKQDTKKFTPPPPNKPKMGTGGAASASIGIIRSRTEHKAS